MTRRVALSLLIVLFATSFVVAQATLNPEKHLANVQVQHVFIVMEENHGWNSVVGNPQMPYLNSLLQQNSVAQGYFADTHPSIGNYFMLTTGQIITNNDGFNGTVSVDNIVRDLIANGKTWKEYSESIPFVGYTGGDTGLYAERHNPCSYFSDVRGNQTQMNNLVPFTQLATDIANHTLPNYGFIVPNLNNDAHNGTLAMADTWLQANIPQLLNSPDFNTPGGGLLIIAFDEAETSDSSFGGGHVVWVAVGPDVRQQYPPAKSEFRVQLYQHESTLRFMMQLLGLSSFPGNAATAPDMTEFILGD